MLNLYVSDSLLYYGLLSIVFCVSVAIVAGRFIYRIYHCSQLKSSQKTNKPELFRFEIIGNAKEVRILYASATSLSGENIGNFFQEGITLLDRQDPLITRILLLQTLEVLLQAEDVQEAFSNFKAH